MIEFWERSGKLGRFPFDGIVKKDRPQQAITQLRSGLRIGRDAGRIAVGGSRDQPGSKEPEHDIRTFVGRFVEAGLGGTHGLQIRIERANCKIFVLRSAHSSRPTGKVCTGISTVRCTAAGGPFQFTPTKPGTTPRGLEEAHGNLRLSLRIR